MAKDAFYSAILLKQMQISVEVFFTPEGNFL